MVGLQSDTLETAVAIHSTENLPSIFEVLAQENLKSSLRPAFEYLVKVIAHHHPENFGWLFTWYDEIFTIVEGLVLHHFLLAHVASYAERYYGLCRKVDGVKHLQHYYLDRKHHILSLLSLTLLPYVEVKLQKIYQKIEEKKEQSGNNCQLTLFGKLIYWSYPYMYTAWQCLRLLYQFRYTIRKSKFYDPVLNLLRIKLVVEDPLLTPDTSKKVISRVLTRFIGGGVHAGVFALQFIDWWYNEENQSNVRLITQLPIPDPPKNDSDNSLISKRDKTTCPICKRTRRNDATISTSGYVFCYTCIYKYIQSHSKCPVTNYPTKIEHIIKLYIPE